MGGGGGIMRAIGVGIPRGANFKKGGVKSPFFIRVKAIIVVFVKILFVNLKFFEIV